jgi:Acyl-CoA dehydrogenase, C-terminal domain
MAAFASGVGSRALAELLAAAPKTKRVMAEGVQADDQIVQFGVGELEGRLRAARRHYLDLTSHQDHSIAERGPDASLALDILQATHTLTRAARDMTVFAFDNASTTVVLATDPLQRCLRDIFTGLKHGALTPVGVRLSQSRLSMLGNPSPSMFTHPPICTYLQVENILMPYRPSLVKSAIRILCHLKPSRQRATLFSIFPNEPINYTYVVI